MKIVSFNLRSNLKVDGINNYRHRMGFIYEKLSQEKPEIVAFQEMGAFHLETLQKLFPEYLFLGHSRIPERAGEGLFTAILKDAVEFFGMEIFWLGPDPYDPKTRFEGQSVHPRMCVETLLRHKESGKYFRVYNVHTDQVPTLVDGVNKHLLAIEGLRCVLNKVTENKKKMPAETVILGDFNATVEDGVCDCMGAYKEVPLFEATHGLDYTFHEYDKTIPYIKIDYIFVSETLKSAITGVTRWEDKTEGIWLSDHFPVCMELDV